MTLSDREIDALVAEKIMGWDFSGSDGFDSHSVVPCYGDNLIAAWSVIDKLAETYPQVRFEKTHSSVYTWYVKFWSSGGSVIGAAAKTVERAIRKAALRTIDIEIEDCE